MIFRSSHLWILVGTVLSVFGSAAVRAEIISSNLAQITGGYGVLSAGQQGGTDAFAQAFQTTVSNTVTVVTANVSMTAANSFLAIYDDVDDAPGSLVATIASGTHPLAAPTDNNVFSGLAVALAPDTKYWLVLGGSTGSWGDNNSGLGTGPGYLATNTFLPAGSATWHPPKNTAPFRMSIQAVPEPSSLTLAAVAVGCAAWAGVRRRAGKS
jgi:hypothetical protein